MLITQVYNNVSCSQYLVKTGYASTRRFHGWITDQTVAKPVTHTQVRASQIGTFVSLHRLKQCMPVDTRISYLRGVIFAPNIAEEKTTSIQLK